MEKINYPELLIGFLLGMIGTAIYEWYKEYKAKKKAMKVYGGLKGDWIERIDEQPEREFSRAKFDYDKPSRTFKYNGWNYNNDSSDYYSWETEEISIDTKNRRLLYIYIVRPKDKQFETREGFGVSFYTTENDKYRFTNGYFMDADRETKAKNLTFIRAEVLAKMIDFDLENKSDVKWANFISKIIEHETTHKVRLF